MSSGAKKEGINVQPKVQYSLNRYIFTGAGLGFYFGMIFQPQRAMNLLFAFKLSILITVVVIALRYVPRSRPPVATLGMFGLKTFATYAILLLVLEGRYPMHALAGRIGVMAMTTAMGCLLGLWYAKRGGVFEAT